jgi:RNA polymerase primary sigma factor
MATKTTDKGDGEVSDAPTTDSPLLDLSDQAVKRMIKLAKKRGFVTHEEINEVLPSEEVTSDQIEDVFAMLNDMGINVVEQEEAEADTAEEKAEGEEEEEAGTDLVEATRSALPTTTTTKEPTDRTDDPVRMYLREMGSVELLSREG